MSPIICPCRSYRYSLTPAGTYMLAKREAALFIVLKPGAADGTLDNPTVRCCRTFTRDGDCNGIRGANQYAQRSVASSVILARVNPLGRTLTTIVFRYLKSCTVLSVRYSYQPFLFLSQTALAVPKLKGESRWKH